MGVALGNPGVHAALLIIALTAWFALIVAATTSFSNPAAFAIFRNDLHYVPQIVTRFPRHAAYLFPVALFLFSGAGAGDIILMRLNTSPVRSLQRTAFSVGLGLVAWTLALLVVGYTGYLTKNVLYPLMVAGTLLTLYRVWLGRRQLVARVRSVRVSKNWITLFALFLIALLAVNLYIALLGALMPEVQFDGRYYHLAEAVRYALHGRIFDLVADTRLLPFAWPQYQEILYSGVIVLFGVPAAKVLSWFNLVFCVLAIFAFSLEFFKSRFAGLLAGTAFVSIPIVSWSAATAGNDLISAPFTVLSVFAFLRGHAVPKSSGWLFLSGLLAGFTLGIKPFGALNIAALAVLAIALELRLALRGRAVPRSKTVVAILAPFLVGCLITALPSLIRSAIITGDPVFPALNNVFHSKYLTSSIISTLNSAYGAYGADLSWAKFPIVAWNVTVHSDQFRNIVGPLLLWAAPFVAWWALFAKRQPLLRLLLAYGFLFVLFWYGSK
ncbi:MAG: hypothetical protein JO211_16210, partial [Acidobacteriaceae bacterium]|nr:hypothetical protein [Acidobacteriaceae bacterium]